MIRSIRPESSLQHVSDRKYQSVVAIDSAFYAGAFFTSCSLHFQTRAWLAMDAFGLLQSRFLHHVDWFSVPRITIDLVNHTKASSSLLLYSMFTGLLYQRVIAITTQDLLVPAMVNQNRSVGARRSYSTASLLSRGRMHDYISCRRPTVGL